VVRDDGLEHLTQELGDHVSTGHQKTSYKKIDQRSNATTDQDFIDDYPIIWLSPH
jgi:regulator of sigma D